MTLSCRSLLLSIFCVVLALTQPRAQAAEAVVKPLPTVDTSKLPATDALEVNAARIEFDKAKPSLVGDDLAEAYAKMGAQYARYGFADAADIALYDAQQLSAFDGRWPYLRGVLAQAKHQLSQARDFFQVALKLDQAYLPIRLRLADTLVEAGDLDGAKKLMLDLTKKRQDLALPYAILGEIALKQKQFAEAGKLLSQALKIEPQANHLHALLAEAYTGQGNAQAAKDAQARAGSGTPTMEDPLVSGMYGARIGGAAVDQAGTLLRLGRLDEARARLAEALRAHPKDVVALSIAARIEAASGNIEGAKRAAADALKADENSGVANFTQGLVLEMNGDETQANTFYETAVRIDPSLPEARMLLGNLLMRKGRFSQAAEQYRQIGVLQPDNTESVARLAAAQFAGGKCAEAIKDINHALSLRPRDGSLLQVFVRLVSTCPAARQEERSMAMDYAKSLVKQRADGPNSEALAIALAAQGKYQEARDSQAAAIFAATRAGDSELAMLYKFNLQRFENKQAADKPWPADHPYFKPPTLKTSLPAPKAPEKPKG